MKVTVRVDVEPDVRDEAASQLGKQGLTSTNHALSSLTGRSVADQTSGRRCPNGTTVHSIEAAR